MNPGLPLVRLAVQAHLRGALDFGALRRYRANDVLRRRLVYGELNREIELELYRTAFHKASWFVAVAENRREVAKSADDMYRRFVTTLTGQKVATEQMNYQDIWEKYWGVRLDSDEWREEERRILLDRQMREKERKK